VLAYDQGNGAVTVVDVDRRKTISLPVPGRVRSLLFSADGRSLVVATDTELVSLDPASGELHRLLVPPPVAIATSPGATADVIALLPGGAVHRIAIDGSGDRTVATVPGATAVAWSPDGRTILVPDPAHDRWHLLDAATGKGRTLDRIAERLDPDGLGSASFPAVAGWCC
jgi:sugar lactone lactonase YvrE